VAIQTAQQRENLAVAYGGAATHGSLHTASPSQGTPAEVTGGSPAYARKALTWAAGSVDGVVTASATFDVPAGATVTHAAVWSAATGGTLLDFIAVTQQQFSTQGQLTANFTYNQS
jgi:hypothetical protein